MVIRAGWLYPFLVAAVLGGAIALRIADPFLLQALRSIAFDTYQRREPAAYNPDSPVRIVAIDQASLDRVGPWPWPPETMARLLKALSGQRAALVAFDILFAGEDDAGDRALAAAIGATPTVLPIAPSNQPADDPVPGAKAAFSVVGDDPRPFIPAFANVVTNGPPLDKAAAGLGAIDRGADAVAVIRRIPLVVRVGGTILPSFALEVLRVAHGDDAYVLTASSAADWAALGRPQGVSQVAVGATVVPTDPDGGMRLDLRLAHPEADIPAWQVLAGRNDAGKIAGRIVLVGVTAPGLVDLRATPLESAVPHVAIEAEAIEHILAGRILTRPAYVLAIEIAVTVVVGLLLAWLLPRLRLLTGVAASLVAVGLVVLGGWFAFRDLGVVLDPTWPALTLWVLAASAVLYMQRRLERRRAEVRAAFGHSLAPAAVDAILAHPGRLVVTGETRELTILACKVREFSTLAPRLEAQELIGFVNSVYAPVSHAILAHGGTIASNTGDTVMAFWNAPLDDEDHAANACHAAADAVAAVRAVRDRRRSDAAAAGQRFGGMAVSIGVTTGACCVGNLGIGERFDYSAIGEEVGLADRLARLSEIYGVAVIAAEATVEVTDAAVLELDLVRIRGRTRPTRLFTLIDGMDADRQVLEALVPVHANLVACYRGRDWDGAAAALTACRAFGIGGLATLYNLYRTRLETARAIEPPVDWDGADAITLK
jgi:adenylate cyclase